MVLSFADPTPRTLHLLRQARQFRPLTHGPSPQAPSCTDLAEPHSNMTLWSLPFADPTPLMHKNLTPTTLPRPPLSPLTPLLAVADPAAPAGHRPRTSWWPTTPSPPDPDVVAPPLTLPTRGRAPCRVPLCGALTGRGAVAPHAIASITLQIDARALLLAGPPSFTHRMTPWFSPLPQTPRLTRYIHFAKLASSDH